MSSCNKYRIVLLVISFLISALINSGCDSQPTDSFNSNDVTIVINSPLSNDIIEAKPTLIDFNLILPVQLKKIEVFIDNIKTGEYSSKQSGYDPEPVLNLDSSFIGKSIDYFIVGTDLDGNRFESREIKYVMVAEVKLLPQKPYDLQINHLGENDINLSWKDSSELIDTYEIWRKNGFAGEFFRYQEVGGKTFNINDGINENVITYYKIKSLNKFGTSGFSESINTFGVGSSGTLLPPTNLFSEAKGTKIVVLSWIDNSSDENFFKVERRLHNSEFKTIDALLKDHNYFVDSSEDLIAGIEYIYRVRSYSDKDSAWSNESSAITFLYDVPPPSNLYGVWEENSITLTWIDNDLSNTIFEIERMDGDNGIYKTIAEIPGHQTSYNDVDVKNFYFYHYRIRSYDGTYYSLYSNEITVFAGI